jgi:CHAT domain-containing protein/tetratricopeptide (TPR) repeat protein
VTDRHAATEPAEDLTAEQILADPHQASRLAEHALTQARARRDGAAQASAERIAGLAAHALHDAAAAAAYLRRAIRTARRCGNVTLEAEARMSYALVLDDLGRSAAALREIDRACQHLSGLRLARAGMQRALILRRAGRDDDALAGYGQALAAFRRHGDAAWEGRVLINRGILRGYRGELSGARADLTKAEQIFRQLGLATVLAQTQHNLGFLAAQAGDVTLALDYYDQARERLSYVGARAVTELDRAEVLLTARLLPEAREAVTQAIGAARAGRFSSLLGQAQLMSARIELTSGATVEARVIAARARSTFIRQGRPTWAVLARRAEVAARVAGGGRDRRAVRALEQAGDELAAAAWLPRAWDAWVDAAHLAIDLGDTLTAARCLDKAAVGRATGPAPLRARAWHAAALVALQAGHVALAKRRAAAGYREIELHQASLGATELGMLGGSAGVEIAALRLRLSLRESNPRAALRWLQRVRGAALRLPPARPSDDPVIVASLAELRGITSEIATAAVDSSRLQRLLRRQRTVEEQVRQRSWRSTGSASGQVARQPELAELAAGLGDRALVELFALDGSLHALVLAGGRVRHRYLCAAETAMAELEALRFAIRRNLVYKDDPAAARRAAMSIDYAAGELDRLLLGALSDLIGDRELVLAPTGALHALPWAMLASCRARPVSVTPSSWQWWQVHKLPASDGEVVLISGPAPQHAAAEVAALHRLLPDARPLTGPDATVARTLSALDGARWGHLACHGTFRADNPLFSHLSLANGPMTVADISALRQPPSLLMLSSCDAGLSAVHPGDELQGLAASLLALGTRTVIASLGPVNDEATLALATDLYTRLRAGAPPAAALAAAQAAAHPEHAVSAANFVCMGAG